MLVVDQFGRRRIHAQVPGIETAGNVAGEAIVAEEANAFDAWRWPVNSPSATTTGAIG